MPASNLVPALTQRWLRRLAALVALAGAAAAMQSPGAAAT